MGAVKRARYLEPDFGEDPQPRRASAEGVVAFTRCPECSAHNQVVVTWEEAALASEGFVPPGWRHPISNSFLQPRVGCAACDQGLRTAFRVIELRDFIENGITQGFVTREQIDGLAAPFLEELADRAKN